MGVAPPGRCCRSHCSGAALLPAAPALAPAATKASASRRAREGRRSEWSCHAEPACVGPSETMRLWSVGRRRRATWRGRRARSESAGSARCEKMYGGSSSAPPRRRCRSGPPRSAAIAALEPRAAAAKLIGRHLRALAQHLDLDVAVRGEQRAARPASGGASSGRTADSGSSTGLPARTYLPPQTPPRSGVRASRYRSARRRGRSPPLAGRPSHLRRRRPPARCGSVFAIGRREAPGCASAATPRAE